VIAWYGNAARDIAAGKSFGSGTSATLKPGYFTLDSTADHPDHGWQTVALPTFTVSGSDGGSSDAGVDAGTSDAGSSGTSDAGTSDAGTDGGTSPGTTPSGGCGSGSGSLAAIVMLALLAARRLRPRQDS
jgi:hypothetical protein